MTSNHKQPAVIHISISGPVQSGKSAVMASIRNLLMEKGYCVAMPERSERENPSYPLCSAQLHEIPKKDDTVFVLKEEVS